MKYIVYCDDIGFGITTDLEGSNGIINVDFEKESGVGCEANRVTVLSQAFAEYIRSGFFMRDIAPENLKELNKLLQNNCVQSIRMIRVPVVRLIANIVPNGFGSGEGITVNFRGEFFEIRGRGAKPTAVFYVLKRIFDRLFQIGDPEVNDPEASVISEAERDADAENMIARLKSAKGWQFYHICRDIVDRARSYSETELRDVLDSAYKAFIVKLHRFQELLFALTAAGVLQPDSLPMTVRVWLEQHDQMQALSAVIEMKRAVYGPSGNAKQRKNKLLYAFYNHFGKMLLEELEYVTRSSGEDTLVEPAVRDMIEQGRAGLIPGQCISIMPYISDVNVREALIDSLKLLPDTRYLMEYLRNRSRDQSSYDHSPCTEEECADVDLRLLYRFFSLSWGIDTEQEIAHLYCMIKFCANQSRAAVLSFQVDMAGKIRILNNDIENRTDSPIARAVYNALMKNEGADIRSRLEQADAAIRKRAYDRMVAALNDSIDTLMKTQPKEDIQLEEDALADIQFSVSQASGWSSKDEWLIDAKIGTKRPYVVRDMFRMINMFRKGETFDYGKSFTFTHRIENIVPEKRAAVEWLMLCARTSAASSYEKSLRLNDSMCYVFLEKLKGSRITFDREEYLLRMDERSFAVRLDRKAILRVTPGISERDLMALGAETLIINREDHVIDRVVGTEEQKLLYRFAIRNANLSIEPVFDKFYEQVYARFYSDIQVAEELKDRMHLSEIVINAYFDFDHGAITVRSEVKQGEVTVEPEQLTAVIDRSRYAGYAHCLDRLGFKNGILKNEGRVLHFLSLELSGLKKYCNVFLSESILNEKVQNLTPPMLRIDRESTVMKAFFENSEYSDEELKKIMKAIRKRKKFILLTDDRVIDLSGENAVHLQEIVDDIGLNENNQTRPQQISMVQALRAFAHERDCRIDQYLYDMIGDIRDFKHSKIEIPPVQAQLRPYQAEGFRWLRILADYGVGGILADDMGLGKTLQFITLLRSDPAPGADLVVCPKSLVFNWVNEFKRFAPDMDVMEIYGTPEQRRKVIPAIDPAANTVYVTSYDSLRNDLEYYQNDFRYLLLDEAQYIKNVNAQKSQSVKQLNAQHRFALTGTPIENSVLDLWSIFDFIMPGYFDEIHAFKSEYTKNEAFANTIARRIAPFVLRRTKRDVLKDLPDKYERIHTVEMTKEQRKVYDAYKLTAVEQLKAGANPFEILPYLMRLRQICDDPALFVDNYKGGSGKMDEAYVLIENALADGHRLLVFSQFVQALRGLERILNAKGIPYYMITGDTNAKERIERMNAFNEGGNINVFLISLKAGGTGLNLTGADTVLHLDPWWNAAAEDQASDRAHRIGQTRNVEVIKLICAESVEQRVIELQNLKKDIIDKLISDNDSSVTAVTAEDISFILK